MNRINRVPQHTKLNALTSIRLFFAMMVMVGHFMGHFPETFEGMPGIFYQMAPAAVSLFFMLSGFIIAYNYPTLKTNDDRRRFIISRIGRIWPVHVVTLIAAVFIVGRGLPSWFLAHLTLTQTWSANPDMAGAYNGPSWSVSNEMFFYLVYLATAFPRRWVRALAIVIPITIGFAIPLANGCFAINPDPTSIPFSAECVAYLYEFPPARIVEFFTGVALFHVRPRVAQTIGLVLIVLALGYILPALPGLGSGVWPFLARQIALLVGGGAFIVSLSRSGWLAKLLDVRWLAFGGEISYSIYMVHQLAMFAVLPLIVSWRLSLQFCFIVTVTIALSSLLFLLIESPARRFVRTMSQSGLR